MKMVIECLRLQEIGLKLTNSVTNRVTRLVLKVLGLWNEVPQIVQEATDVHAFKKEIKRMNRFYVKL